MAGVPFVAALANWTGDLFILARVGTYSSTSTVFAVGASRFTTLKLAIIGLTAAVVLVGGFVALARTPRRSAADAPSSVALTAASRASGCLRVRHESMGPARAIWSTCSRQAPPVTRAAGRP